MIDIVSSTSSGMGVYDTQTERAGNILSVQVGGLEYAKTLGIDLKYFLTESVRFQNESFKAHLIEVLANHGINVSSLVDVVESLASQYTIYVTPEETSTGMVAR